MYIAKTQSIYKISLRKREGLLLPNAIAKLYQRI